MYKRQEEKIEKVPASGASLCTGGDASCLLHLDGAMHRREARGQDGRPLRTVHLAEILAATRENPLEVDGPVELSIPASAGARRGPSARVEEARR